MATRTPHTGVAGEVFTAANLAKYPKGWIGYALVTSGQGSITTETTLTNLTATPTFGADRLIRISVLAHVKSDTAGDRFRLRIKLDGTTVGDFRRSDTTGTFGDTANLSALVVGAAAGSHAITVTLEMTSGTGDLALEAAATTPAILLIDDLGPDA